MVLQNGFNLRRKASSLTPFTSPISLPPFSFHLLVTLLLLLFGGCGQSKHVPEALDIIDGLEKSHGEQVSFPHGVSNGIYGNHMINGHMGALVAFKGKLYAGFSSGIQ